MGFGLVHVDHFQWGSLRAKSSFSQGRLTRSRRGSVTAQQLMAGREPGARGVIAADEALHSAGGYQPAALQHEGLAVADLLGQVNKAPIGQQTQRLDLLSPDLDLAVAVIGFGPGGADRGRATLPTAQELIGCCGGFSEAPLPARNSRISTSSSNTPAGV